MISCYLFLLLNRVFTRLQGCLYEWRSRTMGISWRCSRRTSSMYTRQCRTWKPMVHWFVKCGIKVECNKFKLLFQPLWQCMSSHLKSFFQVAQRWCRQNWLLVYPLCFKMEISFTFRSMWTNAIQQHDLPLKHLCLAFDMYKPIYLNTGQRITLFMSYFLQIYC